jgi:hypothetical protein
VNEAKRQQWVTGYGEWRDAMQRTFTSELGLEIGAVVTMIGFALGLGFLGAVLFSDAAAGVNVSIWIGVLIVTFLIMARELRVHLGPGQYLLLAATLGMAVLVAGRASLLLQTMNLAATIGLLILAVALPPATGYRRLRLGEVSSAVLIAGASVIVGVYRLLAFAFSRERIQPVYKANALFVGRALVVTLPVLLTFGGLFVAADAVFESQIRRATQVDMAEFLRPLAWFVGCAWVAGGVIWCGLVVEIPAPPEVHVPERRRLKSVETSIVLGSLAVLFALFVAIQVRYLFGGETLVQRSLDLTYAEYARRGFFELVAVSLLLLPLLLAVNWAREHTRWSALLFRLLALALVVLLFVVMGSALQRLRIYEETYGLTVLRFYAVAILFWLGAVFLLFVASVLLREGREFLAGTGLAALLTLVILNGLGPDNVIAATNLNRIDNSRPFDADHASRLSADAVPALVEGLHRVPPPDRCRIATALLDRWRRGDGPRAWNWGRHRAVAAVESHRGALAEVCRPT